MKQRYASGLLKCLKNILYTWFGFFFGLSCFPWWGIYLLWSLSKISLCATMTFIRYILGNPLLFVIGTSRLGFWLIVFRMVGVRVKKRWLTLTRVLKKACY
jgi:hypothetical protein